MIKKIIRFFTYDLWLIPTKTIPGWHKALIQNIRVIALAIRGFLQDQCQLRASALTFYVLLSIVPLMALLFAIAKGFGIEQRLQEKLYTDLAGQEVIVSRIFEFSQAMLQHTKEGWIAGIGFMILFWTTVKLLGNIEAAFNYIWGIKKHRSFIRKITDYLALLLFCPILILSSSTLTVLVTSKLTETMDYLCGLLPILSHFDFLVFLAIKIIPYLVLWILFTFIYLVIPNTKVKFGPAFAAGIITGIAFHLLQWGYIKAQLVLTSYGVIYGSFSALPLFLIWLQLSWLIILFGAQIAYACQNVDLYEYDPTVKSISPENKRLIALNIVDLAVSEFKNSVLLTAEQYAKKLNVPIRLINHLLHDLNQAGVLSEVNSVDNDIVYQPGQVVENLTIQGVINSLDSAGMSELPFDLTENSKRITEHYLKLKSLLNNSTDNIRLG